MRLLLCIGLASLLAACSGGSSFSPQVSETPPGYAGPAPLENLTPPSMNDRFDASRPASDERVRRMQ
jgi:hypothetical protein